MTNPYSLFRSCDLPRTTIDTFEIVVGKKMAVEKLSGGREVIKADAYPVIPFRQEIVDEELAQNRVEDKVYLAR